MTYTFKLARRLAILRHFPVLTVLALVVACVKDVTAPDSGGSGSLANSNSLQVLPRSVTIETSQPVQFRSLSRPSFGSALPTRVEWTASGGTIRPDGMFSSSTSGTFKVIGRGRGWRQVDTSTVTVVVPISNLARIEVTPASVTLQTGATRTFTATGYLSDGSTAPVGIVWSATGGDVDPSGVYTAGSVAGSYRVIAASTSGTLADTASITLTEPTPTLASVVVSPATTLLATGATKQFKAYGLDSAGDSVAVAVSFVARGGTITSSGLYTAGSTAGTYSVVAAASGVADTAIVTVSSPTLAGGTVGLPFGATALFKAGVDPGPFSLSNVAPTASSIVSTLDAARSKGMHLFLALTGGPHTAANPGCCLSVINGVLQFDRAKWDAVMATFNTATIRNAVAQAVSDGTILGANVMDEPYVCGGGDGNTWGPCGTMTKVRVDSLCAAVQQIFPTLAAGVQHGPLVFEPNKSYRVCQFISGGVGNGDVATITARRDSALALGARDHLAILFGINVLAGGDRDTDGTWDCTGPNQAGKGPYAPLCRMTADRVRERGLILGPAGCGLLLWRYDDTYWSRADNQQAFKDVEAAMATAPSRACRRS